MTWVTLLPKLVALLATVLDFAKRERERGLGRSEAIASALDRARMEVARATKIRDDERRAIERDYGRLRRDDGFKRAD